ncbi:8012_t:CDS:2 [Diversispora eburnea]|uniref:8012_t:CDS:1 n=1 Tax=Diversispora eburnea TaxID=1213867 RepID=A0A9N9BWH1_9GLOM|nr:8012_t:CDS:2 [Diversispora eburnea]
MELDKDKDKNSELSDSEYDIAKKKLYIHFKKIKDPYINRIVEEKKFNKGEKIILESQEPIFKTFSFKHETIEIIREDRIGAIIEKRYNKIINQIEDETLQESSWTFV